jgi:hypothetical protein
MNGKRWKAAGEAPVFMNYLTMAMKLNPNLERAIEFTGGQLSGEMGRDLERRISESRLSSGINRALKEFAGNWRDACPELERGVHLVESAAGERNPVNRERTLDRALEMVLEGTRKRMRDFASSIHLPTLVIYAIGVLVPLVLVVLLPTFSMMNTGIGLAPIATIYLLILPFGVYLMSRRVLLKRPNVLNPTSIPTDPPSLRVLVLVFVLGGVPPAAALVFGFPKDIALLVSLWGVISAVSLGLYLTSVGAFRRRQEADRMEGEFCEVLVQLGNRVSEGCPAEEVFKRLAEGMKGGALEQVFMQASANISFGGVGLRTSLLDEEYGALAGVNSRMIKGTMRMLVSFVERSTRAAGRAILHVAEHLRKLVEIKGEIKKLLGELVTSMRSVALFFAPLVVSVTARLQELLFSKAGEGGLFGSMAIPPADFTFVLSVYTVILTALLMNYVVELELGNDRVVKRMVIAVSLPVALAIFTAGWIASGWALGALVG